MNTITKGILPVLILTLLFSSCKKDKIKEEPNNQNASDDWLLAPSSGWQHVMSIADDGSFLEGYDMTMVGQEIGVLYGSVIYSGGGPTSRFYKAKFREGNAQAPQPVKLEFSTVGRTIFNSQFIPDSYIPVFTNFEGMVNTVGLIDENNTRTTRWITDRQQPSDFINYHYTKAGDFLGAVVLGSHVQYGTGRYPTPVVDRMPMIDVYQNFENFNSKIAIPLKLSDDQPYTFTIGTEGAQLKYRVLKLLPDKQDPDPNYEVVDQAEITGLQASSLDALLPYRTLVTYSFENDVLTFVLADFEMVSNVYQMNKLHCYRWKKGVNGISVLWESPKVAPTLANAIGKDIIKKDDIPTTMPYLENRLTPDGTFYTLYTKQLYTEPSPDQEYAVLYTVNATGIKELNRTDYIYQNYKKTVRISNCRYMNGVYYALVYPIGTEFVKPNTPKYHVEVVKLNP